MKYGLVFLFTYSIFFCQAQITGTKIIGIDYTTLATAINSLNSQGVGSGGVVINIPAGYTETAPAGGFVLGSVTLNSSLSASNTVTIQKTPGSTGANPLLTAFTGTSNATDGIFIIQGADYVTINSIDLQESSANSPFKKDMEWGFALVKLNATDGTQNVSISNCHISLDINYINSTAIYIGNNTSTSLSALSISTNSGINSNININGCTISNCFQPIVAAGYTASSAFYDKALQIGTVATNTISNFGGSSSNVNGINVSGQQDVSIQNNNINFTVTTTLQVSAINIAATCKGTVSILNNTITASSTSNSSGLFVIYENANASIININGNNIINSIYSTSTNGSFYAIFQQGEGAGSTVTINNNKVTGCAYTSTSSSGTGTNFQIYKFSGSATTVSVSNNIISNNTETQASSNVLASIIITTGDGITVNNNSIFNNSISGTGTGVTFYGINSSGGSLNIQNNSIHDNIVSITNHSGTLYGIYTNALSGSESHSNNTIYGISSTGAGSIYGIYSAANSTSKTISSNSIYTLSSNGGTIYGIYQKNSSANIYKNKIGDLSSTGNSAMINGIYINGGSTVAIYNCMIGDLKAPSSTSPNAICGISIMNGSSINMYYNTIYLNASSSSTIFGSSALYLGTTSSTITLINNIFYNTSSPGTTGGFTSAFRNQNPLGNSYNTNSNNNLFYAGPPSASNVLYGESSGSSAINGQISIGNLKNYLSPGENASISEQVPFLSTNSTDANFLHINTTQASDVESGGIPVNGISDDFDGDMRNTTTPDIGADEMNGTRSVLPVLFSSFSGHKEKQLNKLEWTTDYEQNVKGFDIENGIDGINFRRIGFLPTESSKGNSDHELKYYFTDSNSYPVCYYRIKQIDIDKKFAYSPVICLISESSEIQKLKIFPNPANDIIQLAISLNGKGTISIYDLKGNIKRIVPFQNHENIFILPINVSQLISGIYFITITDDNNQTILSKSFIKI